MDSSVGYMIIWPNDTITISFRLPQGFRGPYQRTFSPIFSRSLARVKNLRIVIHREGQDSQVIEANNFFDRVNNCIKWSIELIWEEKETRELSNLYSFVLYYEDNFDYCRGHSHNSR